MINNPDDVSYHKFASVSVLSSRCKSLEWGFQMKCAWRLAVVSMTICLLLSLSGLVSPALADNGHGRNIESGPPVATSDHGTGPNNVAGAKQGQGAKSEDGVSGNGNSQNNARNGDETPKMPKESQQGEENNAVLGDPADMEGMTEDAQLDRLLVKFVSSTSSTEMDSVHQRVGGKVKADIAEIGVQVVEVPHGEGAVKAAAYRQQKEVSFVEPDAMAQAVDIPNDPYFGSQWAMNKIQAPQAWDLTHGSENINIAIVDTGVDSTHPDLANKIKAKINFTTSPNAEDNYGHGTHVAGIAAAASNNTIGVAGLGYDSSIYNVKVLGDNGFGYNSWVAQGIIWATDHGAQVINLSLGDTADSGVMEDAVNYAWDKGVVVVAAAGNNYTSSPFYPAYSANCIAVAATDASDSLLIWSDYGDWVDVSAPGVSIYSTVRNSSYGYLSGTSMASPHVAGLAALLYALVTDNNGDGRINDEVRQRLENTTDPIGSTGGGTGRINALNAVSGLHPSQFGTVSGRVTDFNTGLPVEGATVSGANQSVLTDSSGTYSISGISTGTYTFVASKNGCSDASLDVEVIAGQTTTADLVLDDPASSADMWVSAINFQAKGKTLTVTLVIMTATGPLSGAQVHFDTMFAAKEWYSQGITNSTGMVSLVINQPSSGTYAATITSLSAANYTWNTGKGIISASYTFSTNGKSRK